MAGSNTINIINERIIIEINMIIFDWILDYERNTKMFIFQSKWFISETYRMKSGTWIFLL